MITFSALNESGHKLVGLAVTKANLKLLRRRQHARIDLASMGLKNTTLVLVYGDSDAEVQDFLIQHGFATKTSKGETVAARAPWWNLRFWLAIWRRRFA